ncbi:MAG: TRAP transporter small permease [Planctomycetota bacterium]|jgi:TRAP-type C4-dicarboxylate transport system permease small subunit|nr:TRAP transporter small permease [Planctomycetota bacterium]
MKRLIAILGVSNKYLCAAFLAAMVLVVFANTILRYLFNSGIIMGEELVRFFLVWAIYLAVISVYYEHRHIAVTTLTDRLPPRILPLFTFIVDFFALYALGILLWGSVQYYNETTNTGQATGLPYKAVVIPVIAASLCCLCLTLIDMYRELRQYLRGTAPE